MTSAIESEITGIVLIESAFAKYERLNDCDLAWPNVEDDF